MLIQAIKRRFLDDKNKRRWITMGLGMLDLNNKRICCLEKDLIETYRAEAEALRKELAAFKTKKILKDKTCTNSKDLYIKL
jgi:hypothetical protein